MHALGGRIFPIESELLIFTHTMHNLNLKAENLEDEIVAAVEDVLENYMD